MLWMDGNEQLRAVPGFFFAVCFSFFLFFGPNNFLQQYCVIAPKLHFHVLTCAKTKSKAISSDCGCFATLIAMYFLSMSYYFRFWSHCYLILLLCFSGISECRAFLCAHLFAHIPINIASFCLHFLDFLFILDRYSSLHSSLNACENFSINLSALRLSFVYSVRPYFHLLFHPRILRS